LPDRVKHSESPLRQATDKDRDFFATGLIFLNADSNTDAIPPPSPRRPAAAWWRRERGKCDADDHATGVIGANLNPARIKSTKAVSIGIIGDGGDVALKFLRNYNSMQALRLARLGKPPSRRRNPHGRNSLPTWSTRMTTPAQSGTSAPDPPNRLRPRMPRAPSVPPRRATRSSATTAPSATPVRT